MQTVQNNILFSLLHNEVLHTSDYNIYTNVPSNALDSYVSNVNIDVVLTKNDLIIGYIKVIGPGTPQPLACINKNNLYDRYFSSSDFRDFIRSSDLNYIPCYISTPSNAGYTKSAIAEFVDTYYEGYILGMKCNMQYLTESDIRKDYPQIDFKKFLIEQYFVDYFGEITDFGDKYGIVKQYYYDPISYCFTYQFVIMKSYYKNFKTLIANMEQKTVPLATHLQNITLNHKKSFYSIDAAYQSSANLPLDIMFKSSPDLYQQLLNSIKTYTSEIPKTYAELANVIHHMLLHEKHQTQGEISLSLIIKALHE